MQSKKINLVKVKNSLILVFSIAVLTACAICYLPDKLQGVISTSEKKLPIYCVDCSEKKVGLSFDAAWGNGR